MNKKLNQVLALVLTIAALMTGQTAWAQSLLGAGTEADPYVINSVDDWNTFANSNNADTYWGRNVYVRLGADIPTADDIAASKSVTTMVGTSTSNCFQGTFDGLGHTLTVSLTHTGTGDAFAAPFKFLNGATIKRLHTAGTITTNGKMCAGIVGDIEGSVTIQNCQSSVTINTSVDGDGTHGGLAGRVESGKTLTITNCLFDGVMTGSSTNSCGGFVGWKEGSLTLDHCLQAGDLTGIGNTGGATFHRANSNFADFTTCYYKTAYGTAQAAQGTQTDATGSALQTLLGDGWEVNGSGDVVPIMAINPRDLAYATISGMQEQYYYTGSTINVDFTVKDANDQTLTKDQDYTVAFSPSPVQESGFYTLTITGTGNETSGYFGTKSMTVTVVPWSEGTIAGFCGDPNVNGGANVIWTYDETTNTLTISGTGAMQDWHWDYTIINAQTRPWYDYQKEITSVVIDDGVTNIGAYAFYGHTAVTSVSIGSGVTTIGEDAFENCTALTEITIPEGVTSIDYAAFYSCSSLATIEGGSGVTSCGNHVFDGTPWLTAQSTAQSTNVIYFGKVALKLKNGMSGSVNIADETVGIAGAAFAHSGITSITIPASVTNIGTQAFSFCTSLATVTFAEGSQLTTIGENAFEYCSNLEAISFPASVTTIGAQAFTNCTALTAITIPASVTTIGDAAFNACWYLATVNFAEGSQLATIGESAFADCYGLSSITIPASVTTIGDAAFYSCSHLATVKVLPTTPPTMGDNVFIYIGQNLETGDKNFYFHGTAYGSNTYSGWYDIYVNNFSGYTATVIYGATFSDGATTSTEAICSEGTTKYFAEGTKVTLGHGDVPTGYVFTEYTVKDANDDDVTVTENAGDYTFDMPAGDVTVTATVKKDIASCDITVPNQTLEGPNNPFSAITYKFEFANNNYSDTNAHEFIEGMGVDVKDGSTPLTLGTDYEFGSVTYANGDPITDSQIGDECKVEIVGKGNYSGSKWKTFKVIAPDAGGTWGENDNLTWAFHDGTLTITGTGEMKAANSFTNYPWYGSANYIETITIGEGVTSIATYAFGSNGTVTPYSNVASVSLPTMLKTIGEGAFNYCTCTSLNITIPAGITSVGANAFNQVPSVTYTRTFNCGVASTVCLPFDIEAAQAAEAGTFYTFVGIDKTGEKWEVVMQQTGSEANVVTEDLDANKPYLFIPGTPSGKSAGDANEITFSGKGKTTVAGQTDWEETSVGTWTFQGVYESIKWTHNTSDPEYNSTHEANLGKVYGFAAHSYDGGSYTVNPGDFVKVKSGANIVPFRAYLLFTPSSSQNAPRRHAADQEALPSKMSIRLVGANGTVTGIGTLDTTTGEVSFDSDTWYSMDGRRLNSKPSTRGIYIKNGKKVIVK